MDGFVNIWTIFCGVWCSAAAYNEYQRYYYRDSVHAGFDRTSRIIPQYQGFIGPVQELSIDRRFYAPIQSGPYDQRVSGPEQNLPYGLRLEHLAQRANHGPPFVEPHPIPLTKSDQILLGPRERRPFDYLYKGTKQKRPWDRRFYENNSAPFENPTGVAAYSYVEPTDPCDPYEPPKQDFRKMGRRPSRAACNDYIIDIRVQEERNRRELECVKRKKQAATSNSGGMAFIGGITAKPTEFPHMGAVGWRTTNGNWLFKCGSSLITSKFVLTAAHCTKSAPDRRLADLTPRMIRFGTVNLNSISEKYDVNIADIKPFPSYEAPSRDHDIALMELQTEVTFTDFIKPACLWYDYDTSALGSMGKFSGWGVLERGSKEISSTLQAGELDIIEVDECNMLLENYFDSNWDGVTEYQICAGTEKGGVDTAEGDSGGPMQVKIAVRSSSLYYIVGVTSFGLGSAFPNIPGVYTRVASYLKWIENEVWK